jgi:hypothetical protein
MLGKKAFRRCKAVESFPSEKASEELAKKKL